ncbi:hypothetical protein [Streptosporangium sandarakinum]
MTTPEEPRQPDPRREPGEEGQEETRPRSPEPRVPDEDEGAEQPPVSTPSEPAPPRHPDVPTAPEVPEPIRSEPETPYVVPGSTPPAYPGWESAPEEAAHEPLGEPGVPPIAAQPSRFDPPPGGEERQGEPGEPERPGERAETGGTGGPGGVNEPGGAGGRGGAGEPGGTGEPDRAVPPGGEPGRGAAPPPPYEGAPPYQGAPPYEGGGPYRGVPGYPGGGTGETPAYPPAGGGEPYGTGGAYPGPASYPGYPGGRWAPEKPRTGIGTAALVLGIVSIFLLLVCGLGVLTAVAGLIVGIVAVAKNAGRGRGWAGIILSALTLVIAVIFLSWLYSKVGDCANLPPELQRRCIEDRLGIQMSTP